MGVNNNVNLRSLLANNVVKKFLKENNILNELTNKSLFMIDSNNLRIDIDGDGNFDKKINCIFDQQGNITQCDNITDIDNKQDNIVNVLNTWLQLKFGNKDLGFSFGNSYIPNNNSSGDTDATSEEDLLGYNKQQNEVPEQTATTGFNPYSIKSKIEALNLDGIKIELVDNYKPNQS